MFTRQPLECHQSPLSWCRRQQPFYMSHYFCKKYLLVRDDVILIQNLALCSHIHRAVWPRLLL